MVWESYFWKKELLIYAKKFNPARNPPRISEKYYEDFLKDIAISAFMIRMLAERHKFSSLTKDLKLNVFRSPCIKKVNIMNSHKINDLYNLKTEEPCKIKMLFLCNQIIHHSVLTAARDKNRNWSDIFVCSDRERQKYIYRVPLSEIIKLLKTAANDYPTEMRMIYCNKKEDFIVETN
jgi:hypothetical protein